jgi:hypothetical protein
VAIDLQPDRERDKMAENSGFVARWWSFKRSALAAAKIAEQSLFCKVSNGSGQPATSQAK